MTSPALVFDLDGTLVDTAPDLIGALNAVLVSKGRPMVKIGDVRHLVGHGARAMLDRAMQMTGEPVPPESLPALLDAFIAHYRTHIAAESRPFAGVEETLAALQADGARMGVLTNKPQELTDLLIPELDFARFFRAIHGAGKLEVVKPNARVFRHVIEEIGGEGSGAVMIGDSATDVATARAAGCPSIVLTYGYSPEPVETLGADRVTDDFREIPRLVRELLG
ncbi:MAG TPA: HAD-IA family hydrolase [Rhizomicrobium sp.]|nr:HAD-IA family hydrolase [Rhizomicrobium sp.]